MVPEIFYIVVKAVTQKKPHKLLSIFWEKCHYLFLLESYILCEVLRFRPNHHKIFREYVKYQLTFIDSSSIIVMQTQDIVVVLYSTYKI